MSKSNIELVLIPPDRLDLLEQYFIPVIIDSWYQDPSSFKHALVLFGPLDDRGRVIAICKEKFSEFTNADAKWLVAISSDAGQETPSPPSDIESLLKRGPVVGAACWKILHSDQTTAGPGQEPYAGFFDDERQRQAVREVRQTIRARFDAFMRDFTGGEGFEPYLRFSFLATDPSHQNLGIGSRLVKWGCDFADSLDPPLPIWCNATRSGERIYLKNGFVVLETNDVVTEDDLIQRVETNIMRRPPATT